MTGHGAIGLLALLAPGCSPALRQASIPTAPPSFTDRLVTAARDQLSWGTRYDPRYLRIGYPNGDVPKRIGVCTDVLIRAYRAVGYDLQSLVHEDIVHNRRAYRITKADPNIDHRRVANLALFFRRHGRVLPNNGPWKSGDIVWWKLGSGRDHIGILSDHRGPSGNLNVIHNIGPAPSEEDVLLEPTWKIVGHYRFP